MCNSLLRCVCIWLAVTAIQGFLIDTEKGGYRVVVVGPGTWEQMLSWKDTYEGSNNFLALRDLSFDGTKYVLTFVSHNGGAALYQTSQAAFLTQATSYQNDGYAMYDAERVGSSYIGLWGGEETNVRVGKFRCASSLSGLNSIWDSLFSGTPKYCWQKVSASSTTWCGYFVPCSGGNWMYYYSDLQALQDQTTSLQTNSGARMTDFDTYVSGNYRFYVGLYMTGPDISPAYITDHNDGGNSGLTSAQLITNVNNGIAAGKQLAQVESFTVSGTPRYIPVWRTVTQSVCHSSCANQIVTPTNSNYWYKFTGDNFAYKNPTPGSAVLNLGFTWQSGGAFMSLPWDAVEEPNVHFGGTWLYSPGKWHYAIDYGKPGSSWKVRAVADGKVVYQNWDKWSGNTIIVEHDVGCNLKFRTAYLHLRNGKTHDCQASRDLSIPQYGADVPEYDTFLDSNGCASSGTPSSGFNDIWGTDSFPDKQTANMVGTSVKRGDFLAMAGRTGPGGKAGTHLHLFTSVLYGGEWWFVDPYGIYAPPMCYPVSQLDKATTPCSKYPVLWNWMINNDDQCIKISAGGIGTLNP